MKNRRHCKLPLTPASTYSSTNKFNTPLIKNTIKMKVLIVLIPLTATLQIKTNCTCMYCEVELKLSPRGIR